MSLKLRTRASLLIGATFSALLVAFLLLTYYSVRESFEERTIEEMRTQVHAILRALPEQANAVDLKQAFIEHGRTGESALALHVWRSNEDLGTYGPDSLTHSLPPVKLVSGSPSPHDTTYMSDRDVIVYQLSTGPYYVVAAMSEHTTDEIMEEMLRIFDIVLILGVFLSILVAILLSRVAVDPISKLTSATESILSGERASRLPVPKGPQEALKLAQRFNQLLEERERSIETLKTFTADVAHELRSPLTIMRGELEVELRAGELTEEQRDTLESSLEEVKSLSGIVDDLLYLARLDNPAEIELHDLASISLSDRVEHILDRLSTPIAAKRLQVSVTVSGDLSVRALQGHIDRLLYNLLLNAVQYSRDGGSIAISGTGSALSISDTGVGIDPKALPHVTKRFYRADPSRNREHGNVGLGLAIASGIAERYGIAMTLDSTMGVGTTVTLELPA